jgi:SAM-dependent methyltransferase
VSTPDPAPASRDAPASADAAPPPLVLTGERTLPGIPDERYWFERHVVAYALAAEQVHRLRHPATDAAAAPASGDGSRPTVLDAGCGEGYGLAMLIAAGAGRVIGADLDAATVAHATRTYAAADPRIEVVAAELMSLPLADDEVDLTVSFQVIEHLHDIPGYLRSLRRVTRPGGEVLIATPNRLTFTPGSDTPVNPFHTREFTAAELDAELTAAGLSVTRVVGVRHGPRLTAAERHLGAPLPDLLAATSAEDWSRELREIVHATGAEDFEVADTDLDTSLDLVAICRVDEGAPGRWRPPPPHRRRTPRTDAREPAAPARRGRPRPAHPPALRPQPRRVAGRRGVAVPGVGHLVAAGHPAARAARGRRPP